MCIVRSHHFSRLEREHEKCRKDEDYQIEPLRHSVGPPPVIDHATENRSQSRNSPHEEGEHSVSRSGNVTSKAIRKQNRYQGGQTAVPESENDRVNVEHCCRSYLHHYQHARSHDQMPEHSGMLAVREPVTKPSEKNLPKILATPVHREGAEGSGVSPCRRRNRRGLR